MLPLLIVGLEKVFLQQLWSAVYKAKYNNLGGSVAVGLKLMLAHS